VIPSALLPGEIAQAVYFIGYYKMHLEKAKSTMRSSSNRRIASADTIAGNSNVRTDGVLVYSLAPAQ